MELYKEIMEFLNRNKDEDAKSKWNKTIKVHENAIGVGLSAINPEIKEWSKKADFKDIEKLWNTEVVEARIIAAKLLGVIGRKDPDRTFELINKFRNTLEDWATTDTLATQGVRGIIKLKKKEIIGLALESLKEKNLFTRRFGVVIFINFPEEEEAKKIIKQFKNSKEYYIKKAVEWLERKIKKI